MAITDLYEIKVTQWDRIISRTFEIDSWQDFKNAVDHFAFHIENHFGIEDAIVTIINANADDRRIKVEYSKVYNTITVWSTL